MPLKDILTLAISSVGVAVALGTFLKVLLEYQKQGATKRSEIFLDMRSRLRRDASFSRICQLLETDDEELQEIPLVEKDRFLGFFEELFLLSNTGLVNKQVTYYMFGYFAIRCFESENFWSGLNRKHELWAAFVDFVDQMKVMQVDFEYDRRAFHL